jgi:hypothetical protein
LVGYIAAGFRQHNHSCHQSPHDPWPRFLFPPRHVSVWERGEKSVSLCRPYLCCTIVSAWVYPTVTACRSLWTSCIRCHCTILSNIYIRYTKIFCQCRLVQQVIP